LRFLWFFLLSSLASSPSSLVAQPTVKSFITISQMVAANPFQVADPTPGGNRTATVTVQETAAMYALTNTWSGTNTSTLIASSTAPWAWRMLPIASGPTFYTSDGTLNGPRIVDLGANPLFWRGPGSIASSNISSFTVAANGLISLATPSDITLSPGQHFNLRTPFVSAASAKAGDALTLINVGTGEAEFRTPTPATTLYTGDGTIASNRIVTLNGKSLTFRGGPVTFVPVDTFSVDASQFASLKSAGNTIIESPGLLSIRTPNVVAGGSQVGQVLTLSGVNGVVEFAPLPAGASGTNIYNSNGALTGNRVVDLTNRVLQFISTNAGSGLLMTAPIVEIQSPAAAMRGGEALIVATNFFNVRTPNVRNASAQVGHVLTLANATTGMAEFLPAVAQPTLNIYNSDGTISSDRTLQGASRRLTFTNLLNFGAAAQNSLLYGSSSLGLATPNVVAATATNGHVLTLLDAATGRSEFVVSSNLYTANGALADNRTVSGASRNLTFTNFSLYETRGILTNISGASVEYRMRTPSIVGGTAATNQVLTLLDTGGLVDWRPLPVTSSVNIYTSDGTLTGPRQVHLGTNQLSFRLGTNRLSFIDPGGQFTVEAIKYIGMSSITNVQYATEEYQVGAGQRFKLFTPRFSAGAADGQVLTMVNSGTGLADFHPAYNLYNTNGILGGNRIVEGNFRELSLTNLNHFSSSGRTSTISGALEFNLKTPNVAGSTAVSNQVLTLMNPATGTAEYKSISFPTDVSIYTASGTITADRTVTVGPSPRTLSFSGSGNVAFGTTGYFDAINFGRGRFYGVTNDVYGSTLLQLTGASKFKLATPRIFTLLRESGQLPTEMLDLFQRDNQAPEPRGAATIGMVLTLTAADGECDWYFPTNIYTTSGTLTGTRTITGAGNSLNMVGLNQFFVDSTNAAIWGKGSVSIATPKVLTNGGVANGYVLTLQESSSGRVEFAPLPLPTNAVNIYTADGVLTGNRQVNQSTFNLDFTGTGDRFQVNGPNRIVLSAKTNDVFASEWIRLTSTKQFYLNTPRLIASTPALMAGQVLTLAADGTADYQPLSVAGPDVSIYTHDAALTGHRTLSGNNNSLLFTGLNDFGVSSATTTIAAPTRLMLRTPLYAGRQGQFLQLIDQSNGAVEFNTVPTVNLYNSDGALTGNRTVTMSGVNLNFQGPGRLFGTALTSYNLNSTADGTLQTSGTLHLEGRTKLDIFTPKISDGTAINGQVLTLMDQDVGRVEYAALPPDTSIYNANGTLSGPRTVTMNNQTLTFQGFGNMAMNSLGTFDVNAISRAKIETSGELELKGQSVLRLKTPKVNQGAGAVATGQVLTLNNVDGSVEFASLAGTAGSPLQFESTLTDTTTAVNPTTLWFGVGTLNPAYTGALPEPPEGTRLVGRVRRPNAPGGWANTGTGGVSLNFPTNPPSGADRTYERSIFLPDGGELPANTLKEGTAVDLVFYRNWSGPGLPGAWVMVNSGYRTALAMSEGFAVTNSVSRKVTSISFAGVVDTFADLADVPITFKKVSTLGNLTVGDRGHADYYLAAYDPNVSGAISVRSSIDPARMWLRLQ